MTTMQTIKVEFDPTQPVGNRHVYTDEDGPHFEEMSLQDAVIERSAELLVAKVEKNAANLKSIADRVSEKVDELLDHEIPKLVEQVITEPLVVTDTWGSEVKRGSLRDLIVAYAEKQLTYQEGRYGNDRTTLAKVVREQVDSALSSELSKSVAKAKADLTKRLETTAAEVIAKSITRGLR